MLTFGDIFTVEEYPYESHHYICLHWINDTVYCAKIITEDLFTELEKVLDMLRDKGFSDDEHSAFCVINLTTEGFQGKRAALPSPPERPEPRKKYTLVKSLNQEDKHALLAKMRSMKGEKALPKILWEHINSLEF
jgi:hypothetical protein